MSGPFRVVKVLGGINNIVIPNGLVPKGAYDNGTDYAVGDSVSYTDGNSYVMYVNAAAGTLPTDATKWQLLAEKGDAGSDGEGVPTGGTEGQILAKASGTDFDTEWVTNSGGSGVSESLAIAYSVAL